MPQINNGKSPAWVSGEIVTASGLNGMIDAATINPSVITDQTDFPTLTGDEYALIVDPASGQLKKTQLKNSLLTGEDIKTNLISQITGSSAILTIESNPSVAMLLRGTGGLSLLTETGNMTINTIASGGTGAIGVESNGMTFDGQGSSGNGVINFQTRTIFSNTGAIKLPVGTTAQRPAVPVAGDLRFNTTTANTEFYNGSAWESSDPVEAVSLTANGYIKLANGLILQWGTHLVAMANYSVSTVTFPIAFPNNCFNVQLTARAVVATAGGATLENGIKLNGVPTTTNFSVYVNWAGSQAGATIYPVWFAIGN